LTFKGYSATPGATYGDTVKYQGVYFKFGSLVGISPVDAIASASLYVPKITADPDIFYVTAVGGTHDEWTGTAYGDIPRVTETPPVTQNRNDRTVIDMGTSQAGQMKGDICQYLQQNGFAPAVPVRPDLPGLHWRLPTSAEFGSTSGNWSTGTVPGWTKVGSFGGHTSSSVAGTDTIQSGGNFGATANFFPASGCRNASGTLYNTGSHGYYWSGSVYDATLGYSLYFYSSSALPYNNPNRQNVFAVRCVLQE
jgi:hypothetical protein